MLFSTLVRSYTAFVCGFCSSVRDFARLGTSRPRHPASFGGSDPLVIPPHDGYPCLQLTLSAAQRAANFHHPVVAHAGRTMKIAKHLSAPRFFLSAGIISSNPREYIFLCVFMVLFPKVLTVAANLAQGLMQIQVIMRGINYAPCNIRAMVGRALQIRQHI